jgi:hypothetical protein
VKLRLGSKLGLVVGLVIIVGSAVGGVAFANRGATHVIDNPMPGASASKDHDDADDQGEDTPHATAGPNRPDNDADDNAVCEDRGARPSSAPAAAPAPTPTGDCRRGADHPDD